MYFLYQAHIVKQHEPPTSEKSLYQENYTHYTDSRAKARVIIHIILRAHEEWKLRRGRRSKW